MHITFITNSLGYGGAAKMLVFVARSLTSRGHRVSIINFDLDEDRSRCPKDIETYHLDVPYSGTISYNFKLVSKSVFYLKRLKPDVVVGFLWLGNFCASVVGKLLHIPSVICERANPFVEHKNPHGFGKVKKWCVDQADGAVFQTEGASLYYAKRLREKSTIIPNQISLENDVAPINYYQAPKTVVTHGRLDNKQKRLDIMIEGFSIFKTYHPGYVLKIFGTGPDEKMLKFLVKEKQLEDSVFFVGKTTSPILDISKEGIYAITSDYEGISNSLLEAMAVGLPVVSTDHTPGGARMLITDHKDGILVPCGDPVAFADALSEFANNSALAESCGKEATKVLERFAPESIISQWEQYLKRVSQRTN